MEPCSEPVPEPKPLYISPGHRISLDKAIDYVLQCTPRYRLPETTRQAHKLASETPSEQIDWLIRNSGE